MPIEEFVLIEARKLQTAVYYDDDKTSPVNEIAATQSKSNALFTYCVSRKWFDPLVINRQRPS